MHDLFENRVRAIVDEVVTARMKPMQTVMSGTLGREQERIEDQFFDRMDFLQPNWETLNEDPGFNAWLTQVDPAAGVTLSSLLKDAHAKFDADRAVLFFKSYEREVAAAARPAPATAPGSHRPPAPQPRVERTFTGAQIDQFYHDLRIGRYRGREAEATAFEQEIMNAQRAGRVVP